MDVGTNDAAPELVDVVDHDDVVVDVVTRAVMRRDRLRHRAVFIAVLSTEGHLLVHRRSDTKDLWPGWWDIAVGGVVASGEAYDAAAVRELAEEVGVEAGVGLTALGAGSYEDDDVALVARCYSVTVEAAVVRPDRFHDGEVAEAKWVTPVQLEELLAVERFLPDSLALVLPYVTRTADGFRITAVGAHSEQEGDPSGGMS
jgi:isopentenyldiphosphate isomerase